MWSRIALWVSVSLLLMAAGEVLIAKIAQRQVAVVSEPSQTPSSAPDQINQVLAVASLAIGTAQSQVAAMQTAAAVLAVLLGLAGGVNLLVAIRYAYKLEKLAGQTRKLEEASEGLDRGIEDLTSKKAELEQGYKELAAERNELKVEVDVLSRVVVLRTGSPEARLAALRALSQLKHRVGVFPMIDVLAEKNSSPILRCEAAYGLGRYAEKRDSLNFWGSIFECFQDRLNTDETPQGVATAVINSVKRFDPLPQDTPDEFRSLYKEILVLSKKWDLGA
jgi:hypothetical protein